MEIADVEGHLRGRYRAADRGDDESWAVYFADLDQKVIVHAVTVSERPWLLVYTEVCAVVRIDSKTVVGHAATLAVGGLCAYDDRYFLQHSLPMSAMTTDLDAVLYLVAHEAARLRATVPTPLSRQEFLFAHYAE